MEQALIFVAMFWLAVLFAVMRLLTWIAKRHPKARNPAAFSVEILAVFAIAEALADVGAIASGQSSSPGLFLNAVFIALVGGAAHFLASNTATSPHALYPAFVIVSLAIVAGLIRVPSTLMVTGSLLAMGCIVGWLKYRGQQIGRTERMSDEVQQA